MDSFKNVYINRFIHQNSKKLGLINESTKTNN